MPLVAAHRSVISLKLTNHYLQSKVCYLTHLDICNGFVKLKIQFLDVFRAKLHRANVNFLSEPIKDGTTGTVIVLTTPDAQRTMLAYQVKFI